MVIPICLLINFDSSTGPGRHTAQGAIWINIGCILACFNIEKPLHARGNAFEPSVGYISHTVRHLEALE
ncbi:hypothetical protein FIBSPDRAFT_459219 [Athelia psychrophila]|uniref:Uncharacterized protein n=1 Tax=Athelia psychrophila TaxID=1759441 RepID=A0A166LRB5_9AGAM|nr:hypothetical protein FIBSPDRAFT_459219 [Fibularhizoctonia sp. CBS 109695]